MNNPDETMLEWCSGLPLVEDRPLDPTESRDLKRQLSAETGRGMAGIGLILTLGCVLAIIGANSDLTAVTNQNIYMLAWFILLFSSVGVLLLLVRPSFRKSASLRRDLAAGTVKRFAGCLGQEEEDDGLWKLLRQGQLISDADGHEVSLEVLAGSGRVWSIQGRRVKRWIVAQPVSVGATPEFAAIAAQWLEPVATGTGGSVLANRRELTPAEREELRRHARRYSIWLAPFAAGFTLWLGADLFYILNALHQRQPVELAGLLISAPLAVVADAGLVISAAFAWTMHRDQAVGRVIIVRMDASSPRIPVVDLPKDTLSGPAILEILPKSRRVWTIDGRPAAWRTSQIA